LGVGAISTALKRGAAGPDELAVAVEAMTQLNAAAADAARAAGAHALTDVTGFGLLGHLHEMCESSGLSAKINASAVPALPGALDLAASGRAEAGGSARNAADAERFTTWSEDVPPGRRALLTDAMTSGGLLAAVPPGRKMAGTKIGELAQGEPGQIHVR
jgi:selenide,water dikinase